MIPIYPSSLITVWYGMVCHKAALPCSLEARVRKGAVRLWGAQETQEMDGLGRSISWKGWENERVRACVWEGE